MPEPHRERVRDGRGYEQTAGYSRAARRGATIVVSGTTANDGSGGVLHPGDTGAQTEVALRQALDAVVDLGGRLEDVVRTRVYLAPGADWAAAARAHAELMGEVAPANTMLYVDELIGDGFLVEVEIDAVVHR
jgi:enamine deaminase RidA (YjgF/YER057c/UK114 family)